MRPVLLALLLVLAAGTVPAAEPFRLPVGARVTATAGNGEGWSVTGEVDAPLVQARARLMSAVTAADWAFLHEIPLGKKNERRILAFRRGAYELTVMVWRVSVDRSGFSYGLSGKRGQGEK